MTDIDLGFPETRDSAWLSNRYFPSKVGGKPAWLDLAKLPHKEQLQCKQCGSQKVFLCQIYAPYDDEYNFHRSIYVFVCRSPQCQVANSGGNITVLRSLLPKENDFYSGDPPTEDGDPLDPIPTKEKLCVACGCVGAMACSRCKKANYCCAQHQRAHWPHHKKVCKEAVTDSEIQAATRATVHLPAIVLPEWEIVIEPNDEEHESSTKSDDEDDGDDASEQQRLADYEKLVAAGKAGELKDVDDNELEKYTQGTESLDDRHFRQFKKEISKDPEQILRYKRNGKPLWMANVEQTVAAQLQVPNCEYCGGPRQFEFQIMPQMLLLLKDEQLDWGVLAIYTCAASCRPSGSMAYLQEYAVKQDLVEEKQ